MALFLVRGLPGAGKSTLASILAGARGLAIAADDFFMEGGEYRFDASKLAAAHEWCQKQTEAALLDGRDVAVANTFTQRWEVEPYVRLAHNCCHRLVIVSLYDGGLSDAALARRNVHGVPEAAITKMRARWEHDLRVSA